MYTLINIKKNAQLNNYYNEMKEYVFFKFDSLMCVVKSS